MWMPDAEYVYRQDVHDKKVTSYGAFHKKHGAKSKKCNFPSDYLTNKEKKKLNSEITTYDMSKFYTWEEFKQLPPDIQVEYLNGLIKKYDVSMSIVAKKLFNIVPTSLRKDLLKHDVYSKVFIRNHFHPKAEDIERFQNDIYQTRKMKIIETTSEETNVDIEEPVVKTKKEEIVTETPKSTKSIPSANLRETKITLDGFDLETFSFLADKYAGQEVEVKIKVIPKPHICMLSE